MDIMVLHASYLNCGAPKFDVIGAKSFAELAFLIS
jgi:hypothetical protein